MTRWLVPSVVLLAAPVWAQDATTLLLPRAELVGEAKGDGERR